MRLADYQPPRPLRSPHVQAVLGSSRWRARAARRRAHGLLASARPLILTAGDGTRLRGWYSPGSDVAKGLVVLYHGWEGAADSTYILDAGAALHDAGHAVFRFQFRDHGDNHALNQELFHSCRLQEVIDCTAALIAQLQPSRVALVGYSLGGNFALRLGLNAAALKAPQLRVIAICPLISPHHGLDAIERAPFFYQRYFVAKWRASLHRKAELFPHRYAACSWGRTHSLRALTERLVLEHTSYPTLDAYLDGYSVAGDRLAGLSIPTLIASAADDPVIPVSDIEALRGLGTVDLDIAAHGGHCSFLCDWSMRSAVPAFLVHHLQ